MAKYTTCKVPFFGSFIGPALIKGLYWLGLVLYVYFILPMFVRNIISALEFNAFEFVALNTIVALSLPLLWRTLVDILLNNYLQTRYTEELQAYPQEDTL